MLIPASQWRLTAFSPPLSRHLFRRLVREGRLSPPPQWIGRRLYLAHDARVVPPVEADPVVARIAQEIVR
jgi:hypothetical protein